MTRPPISDLGPRRSKPLHRTFPTWAREPKGGGHVQWRMYKAHRFGGALFIVFDATPDMTRQQVATKLHAFRKVLFGRDKTDEEDATTSPNQSKPAPIDACNDQPSQASTQGLGQGSLF